jgi:hypothetical protein
MNICLTKKKINVELHGIGVEEREEKGINAKLTSNYTVINVKKWKKKKRIIAVNCPYLPITRINKEKGVVFQKVYIFAFWKITTAKITTAKINSMKFYDRQKELAELERISTVARQA